MRVVLQAKLYFLKPIRIFDVHSQDDLHLEIHSCYLRFLG